MDYDKIARKWLDELNGNKVSGCIITRTLDDTTEIAMIWATKEAGNPVQAYLIKEKTGSYCGCVVIADNGFYAYILPAQRRKGVMGTALKQVVLPHLLQQNPILRAQVIKTSGNERAYNIARKLAVSAGFEILKETTEGCRLILDASKLKERIYIKGKNSRLSKEQVSKLKDKLLSATVMLQQVQTELEYKTGISGYSEELHELTIATGTHAAKIDTAWFDKR